ncbi:hypothetical protein B0H13DRAFT_2275376 [Mycena leptocephala]|nr:hypothetical protein B0H13DRAFT_2275376 [Mycena leptocephala]
MGLACAMRRRSARASDVLPGSSEKAVLPSDTRTQDARRARKGQDPLGVCCMPGAGSEVHETVAKRLERARERPALAPSALRGQNDMRGGGTQRMAATMSAVGIRNEINGSGELRTSETPTLRSSTQLRPRGWRTYSAACCSLLPSAFFCTDAPKLLAPLEIRIMVMRLPTSVVKMSDESNGDVVCIGIPLFWVTSISANLRTRTAEGRGRDRGAIDTWSMRVSWWDAARVVARHPLAIDIRAQETDSYIFCAGASGRNRDLSASGLPKPMLAPDLRRGMAEARWRGVCKCGSGEPMALSQNPVRLHNIRGTYIQAAAGAGFVVMACARARAPASRAGLANAPLVSVGYEGSMNALGHASAMSLAWAPACGTGLVVRAWTHLAIVHIEPSELEQIQMLAFTIHESS